MAIEQSVAFRRDRLPSVASLVAKARELGFDVSLEDADLATHTGFLPGRLGEQGSGFEWSVSPASEFDYLAEVHDRSLNQILSDRDVVATFRTGSQEHECQLAMICAAAMIDLCDGVYFDDYENLDVAPDRLVAEVNEWMRSGPPANVEVVQGDLLEQDVDVIVNAWNRNFLPWWLLLPQGVSGAIKRRAGVEPFKELRKHGVMRLGEAVLTSAGRLPHKGIIHVAGLTWYWRATVESVRTSTKNACELACEAGFASIGFPIIGAGSGGMNPERAKDVMLETLADGDGALRIRIVEYT